MHKVRGEEKGFNWSLLLGVNWKILSFSDKSIKKVVYDVASYSGEMLTCTLLRLFTMIHSFQLHFLFSLHAWVFSPFSLNASLLVFVSSFLFRPSCLQLPSSHPPLRISTDHPCRLYLLSLNLVFCLFEPRAQY